MTLMEDPLVGREPVSASCNRWTNEGLETEKYGVYPKEHPANCPLRWRLGNDMGVYLSWLQVGLGHHTRKPNGWSVSTSEMFYNQLFPISTTTTSYKTCVYDWQHQAASFKGSNRLSSKWSRDISSMAIHEPGFESNRACLGHARPSCTGSWTSCTKRSQLKQQCIGNGCSYHRSTSDDWLGEWDSRLRPSSKRVVVSLDTELSTMDVVKWLKIDVFQVKWQSYRALWTVKVNTLNGHFSV